jgi:16S rRNA G966 N2-methylase RsmD
MALTAYRGRIYAIERQPDALPLIGENLRRFHLGNVTVIKGEAPKALAELPPPDTVFIGRSGGHIGEIISGVRAKNPQVRIVVTAITLETAAALGAGFVLDLIFGDPPNFPHIIRLMGKLITALEKIFCKPGYSSYTQYFCGLCFFCAVTVLCTGIPLSILLFAYWLHPAAGFVVETFLCYQLLAVKCLRVESMAVHTCLKATVLPVLCKTTGAKRTGIHHYDNLG